MRPTKVFERAGESRMTPPSPTLSRGFTRLCRFLAPYDDDLFPPVARITLCETMRT